jgi:phage baseplate assembly protein W
MATVTFFKDLSLDFTPHPISGDIRPVTDETAIRRALNNLIKTRKGERPFRPDFGSNVNKYLFSSGPFAEDELNKHVYDVISRYETRVIVTRVESKIEKEGIDIKVDYVLRNTNTSGSISTAIKKVA